MDFLFNKDLLEFQLYGKHLNILYMCLVPRSFLLISAKFLAYESQGVTYTCHAKIVQGMFLKEQI